MRAEINRHAADVLTAAIEIAKSGDVAAMRLVLDRVDPAPRDRAVEVDLPRVASIADVPAVALALISAAARGEITPGEAQNFMGLLEGYRKAIETAELAARVEALEKTVGR
jgi:hypothetical protein